MPDDSNTTKARVERIAAALMTREYYMHHCIAERATANIPRVVALAAGLVAYIDDCEPHRTNGDRIPDAHPSFWLNGPPPEDPPTSPH